MLTAGQLLEDAKLVVGAHAEHLVRYRLETSRFGLGIDDVLGEHVARLAGVGHEQVDCPGGAQRPGIC